MRFVERFLGVATPDEIAAQGIIDITQGKTFSWRRQTELMGARRIRRRLVLRRVGLGVSYLITVGAVIGTAAYIWEKQHETINFGELRERVPIYFSKDKEKGRMDVFVFKTERPFDFDSQAFQQNINFIALRGGKLPAYSRVFLSDTPVNPKDPAVLMIGESGRLPIGAVSVEQLGDSTGFVASAIFSRRSHEQYSYDVTQVEYPRGRILNFEEQTYQDFAQNIKPVLVFR